MDVTLGDPFTNLAAEEAIFVLNKVPTLRVWDNQTSVIIGRAQMARFETDLEYCEEHDIPVVRRFTAGGAVYNGPGNLNWSFVAPASSDHGRIRYTRDPRQVFSSFASIVLDALAACSVMCSFVPPNRLETKEGKISGMAAYISRDCVICHGTLLLDADLDVVSKLTGPSSSPLGGRHPRSNPAKVANAGVGRREIVARLAEAAGIEARSVPMGEEEEVLTQSLRGKYLRQDWNLGDPFALDNP